MSIGESSIDKKDLTVVDPTGSIPAGTIVKSHSIFAAGGAFVPTHTKKTHPTGSIRVVFWGDYWEKEVVKDNTYIFKRFRYRSNKFWNYINTLKDGTCSIEGCNSFKEILAEADMAELSEIDERLILLTIEKTDKTYIYLKCSAKIEFAVSVPARCSNCQGLNKLKNCQ